MTSSCLLRDLLDRIVTGAQIVYFNRRRGVTDQYLFRRVAILAQCILRLDGHATEVAFPVNFANFSLASAADFNHVFLLKLTSAFAIDKGEIGDNFLGDFGK
jgi:hypothetical protein